MVHRLALLAPSSPINVPLLTAALRPDGAPLTDLAPNDPDPEVVRDLLRRASGNVRIVADALGLSRAALYRRLKRWKIDPERFRE